MPEEVKKVKLLGREFELFIPYSRICESIGCLAGRLNEDYRGRLPLFVCVLNGAFMFMAELMQRVELECEISFVKMSSYEGTESTGCVRGIIGITEGEIRGRDVIVVEDIVDTGTSIEHIVGLISECDPASIAVAALLFKPDACRKDIKIEYSAISVPNDFIIGFGLDYDQRGRNLKDIYRIIDGK